MRARFSTRARVAVRAVLHLGLIVALLRAAAANYTG